MEKMMPPPPPPPGWVPRILTSAEALEVAVGEIKGYRGAAIDRAVTGVYGAIAVLEMMGLLSMNEAFEWKVKAKAAGDEQKRRTKLLEG